MVKLISFIGFLVISFFGYSQNLSMGVGGRLGSHFVQNRADFNFDILTSTGDTLLLETSEQASLISGLSFPIYARYSSKRNWWVQVNYGYETWRLGISGRTNPTNYAIQSDVNAKINDLPDDTDPDDIDDIREAYEQSVIDDNSYSLESFERVQYNRLTFALGSSFNRRGVATFYYGGGFDLLTSSTFESYQGLLYNNREVSFTHHILEAMPKLESIQFAPFLNFGIEKQNIRFGLDISFFTGPVFGEHNVRNDTIVGVTASTVSNNFSSQFVRNVVSVGVSLNYTLFNQNFNQATNADKKNVLDPLIIGKYRQKPKLIQFGAAINFPNFHNSGWSVIDNFELDNEDDIVKYDDSLRFKDDYYLSGVLFDESTDVLDYLYLEKTDDEQRVIDDEVKTVDIATTVFFDWGNINSIVKSPKLSAFMRVNPHEMFSVDFNAGYQNHTYGIRGYETIAETIDDETTIQTKKVVYQENFHELSFGVNAYTQVPVNNISRIGIHVGLNYNAWFNGRFEVESGGINDSELLQDFHDYNTGQLEGKNDPDFEEAKEWNGHKDSEDDADKGVFTKQSYYDNVHGSNSGSGSYHIDYSNYLFNSWEKRSYFELRFGIDYYIENLKFNLYAERSLLRNNTMYSSLLTLGMGVALFLN